VAYQLETYDSYGNPIPTGGATLRVSTIPVDPNSMFTQIDLGNGLYSLTFYFQSAQNYIMTILINGGNIDDSPFAITVEPSILNIPSCYAIGAGLNAGIAGVQSSFLIITRDAYNNTLSGLVTTPFAVELKGPTTIVGTTRSNINGTITASYVSTIAGSFRNYISASGVNISGSPYPTSISPATISSNSSYLTDSSYPFQQSRVGERAWMQLQVVDIYNNSILVGGQTVVAFAIPTNVTSDNAKLPSWNSNVTDNRNGTYTITYIPNEDQRGEYRLSILLNNANIRQSPFLMEIIGEDKSNLYLIGVGIGVILFCVICLFGTVAYRRWKRRKDYTTLETNRIQ